MHQKKFFIGIISVFCLFLTSCAHYVPPSTHKGQYADNDPIEGVNRMIFSINEAVDTVAIRPVAVVYRDWAPKPAKMIIGNAISHIQLPVTFINNALQGDWDSFGDNFGRFFVNTIIGLGGLIDIYPEPPKKQYFGDTFAHWGIGEGGYFVFPGYGPSNARDSIGTVFDIALNPFNWTLFREFELAAGKTYVEAVHKRSDSIKILDDIKEASVDFYAKIRSMSQQQRYYELNPQAQPALD